VLFVADEGRVEIARDPQAYHDGARFDDRTECDLRGSIVGHHRRLRRLDGESIRYRTGAGDTGANVGGCIQLCRRSDADHA
jgi:hypothetical protein